MRSEEEVRQQYLNEPWGKLINEMGMDPYDTESSARSVARYAAEKIQKLESGLKATHIGFHTGKCPMIIPLISVSINIENDLLFVEKISGDHWWKIDDNVTVFYTPQAAIEWLLAQRKVKP